MKSQYIGSELAKKRWLGQFGYLRGELAKKEDDVFEGVEEPS